ncbi:MAG: hypothetical protein KKI14_04305, partial [Nanoarchaeota archaeon]|nr:hypothetical protein [Nanoarchaeota archaeon]
LRAAHSKAGGSAGDSGDSGDSGGSGDSAGGNSALVLFAGKSEIYIQFKSGEPPILTKIHEAPKILKKNNVKEIFGELLPEQKEALENPEENPEGNPEGNPKGDFKFLRPKFTFGETLLRIPKKNLKKSKIVEPLYIKSPSISTPKPI